MAGIGIRYLEFSRRLSELGFEVVLVHPGKEDCGLDMGSKVQSKPYHASRLKQTFAHCEVVIVQGSLADPLLGDPDFQEPVVVDMYDPWMVENFVYLKPLGMEPFRRDLASWTLQFSRADFVLCSCEPQRLFYLGFLASLGRIGPEWSQHDPDFRDLVDCVPFGLAEKLETFQPLLANKSKDHKHLLFGCVYDWYDPLTLVSALEQVSPANWHLHLVRNPNPETTPQSLLQKVETRCRELGWWEDRVLLHDWFPVERRFDLLREMDLLVSPHRPDLETRLSLRTRYLDALVAECPVIATRGGAFSQELSEYGAGWLVEPQDSEGLARVLETVLRGGASVDTRVKAGREMARQYRWNKVLEPLIRFLKTPRKGPARNAHPSSIGKRLGDWFRRKVTR